MNHRSTGRLQRDRHTGAARKISQERRSPVLVPRGREQYVVSADQPEATSDGDHRNGSGLAPTCQRGRRVAVLGGGWAASVLAGSTYGRRAARTSEWCEQAGDCGRRMVLERMSRVCPVTTTHCYLPLLEECSSIFPSKKFADGLDNRQVLCPKGCPSIRTSTRECAICRTCVEALTSDESIRRSHHHIGS